MEDTYLLLEVRVLLLFLRLELLDLFRGLATGVLQLLGAVCGHKGAAYGSVERSAIVQVVACGASIKRFGSKLRRARH